MSSENLLFFLLVVFMALFTVISAWLRKRIEGKTPSKIEPEATRNPPGVQVPSLPERDSDYSMDPPFPTAATPAENRTHRRSPIGSLRDARRGIVLMTILGTCRALERPSPPTFIP